MKLLAFTDLHLSSNAFKKIKSKAKSENPELLVCAGDISIFEQGIDFMLNKLNKLKKKILMINGNHENASILKKLCRKYKNIIFIHKKYYKHNNHVFLGYGGSGFSLIEPDFYKTAKYFKKVINRNRNKKIILVTHAPPYKTKLDLIVGSHCGNKTLRRFIEKNKIDLNICGHLHENFGKRDYIKKTFIINPGPYGKMIKNLQ
ncbi:metallophosphoesterase [Candidatus Woesearchaeota archaeon]|nr:metallophosphoesterase [Candidatus Woesearchaeota archaeon]